MGCGISRYILSESGLLLPPQVRADPTFSQTNQKYDMASYISLCDEFGPRQRLPLQARLELRAGHGFHVRWRGSDKVRHAVPRPFNQIQRRGGNAIKGYFVYFIRNDNGTDTQFDCFVPDVASGLTQARLVRLNQAIDAFVCSCSKRRST